MSTSSKGKDTFGLSAVDRLEGLNGDYSVYCTFSFTLNTKGTTAEDNKTASTVFAGRAPACAISITEQANISTDRSLSGDWLVLTFGMRLVTIQITGLDIFYTKCDSAFNSKETIQSVFNTYNCATHPKARVTMSLKSPTEASVYKCILVAMEKVKNNMKDPVAGLGTYSITLYGVKQS